MGPSKALRRLLESPEPSLRWKARVHVLGEPVDSPRVRALQEEVRRSARVRALLAGLVRTRGPSTNREIYHKWQGRHWILARLADLGYPPGDRALASWRDRILEFWLRPVYYRESAPGERPIRSAAIGVPRIQGRYRRCASQQGNALYSVVQLGLDDGRGADLAERLLHWQWPDGGWNCDLNPSADPSSFNESLLPMMGLFLHGSSVGSRREVRAARRASEIFLQRKLFRRIADDRVIYPGLVRLHYPAYWHYDTLSCLRAIVAMGLIRDPRCADALDLLEEKQLPDGGWPAEAKFYTTIPTRFSSGVDSVGWGGTRWDRSNPWVTVDALGVLHAAGRIEL